MRNRKAALIGAAFSFGDFLLIGIWCRTGIWTRHLPCNSIPFRRVGIPSGYAKRIKWLYPLILPRGYCRASPYQEKQHLPPGECSFKNLPYPFHHWGLRESRRVQDRGQIHSPGSIVFSFGNSPHHWTLNPAGPPRVGSIPTSSAKTKQGLTEINSVSPCVFTCMKLDQIPCLSWQPDLLPRLQSKRPLGNFDSIMCCDHFEYFLLGYTRKVKQKSL